MTTPRKVSNVRDELAKFIFFADNKNVPTNDLESDWARRHQAFEYVYNIADALLEAGWRPAETFQPASWRVL